MPSGKHLWSTTAASNGNIDVAINWVEGQPPSSVNDSARAQMAVEAKWLADNSGTLTTGGTSTAYTVATNTVFRTLALLSGQKLSVKFNATNGSAPTLNVDTLGAKALQLVSGAAVPTGFILANSIWDVTYDNVIPAFIIHGAVTGALTNIGITPATALTAPAVDDELPIYDLSATVNKKITLADAFKVITLLTAETAPAVDDELALYDLSGTATDKITLANFLKVVNALTEDTLPDALNDFVLTYDASASAAKKVKPNNLIGAAAGVAKAWGYFTSMGSSPPTISASHNVASISRSSTGVYVVTFTTAFTSTNYALLGMSSELNRFVTGATTSTSTATLRVENNSGSAVDPTGMYFAAFGAQ